MFSKFLSITPYFEYMLDYDMKPETDWYGVKALWFEGAQYRGKKTKVFSYIGYPENSCDKKVPAVILVHGGGGHSYAHWVKIWNDRGYAALALDLRGFLPAENQKGLAGTEEQRDDYFERWQEDDEFIAGPDGYGIYEENGRIEDSWLYTAVADTILAHNLLLSDERIDNTKTGITGISWGGVTTSQVIAYDRRFAFAIPIYGSGFLRYSLSEIMQPFKTEEGLKYWEVSGRYKSIDFPVMWLCWNADTAFDIVPNCLSYLATKDSGSVLSICNEMNHAHYWGWIREESYRFADGIVNNEESFVRLKNDDTEFFADTFEIDCDIEGRDIKASLYYITEDYRYNEKSEPAFTWNILEAQIINNAVIVNIPPDAKGYYIELKEKTGSKEYISTGTFKQRRF